MDRSEQIIDWLGWTQIWINSPENQIPDWEGKVVSLASSGIQQGIRLTTGRSIVEKLAYKLIKSNDLDNDLGSLAQSSILACLVIQLWLLQEELTGLLHREDDPTICTLKVCQYYGITSQEVFPVVDLAILSLHGMKISIAENQKLCSLATTWDDDITRSALLDSHRAVFESPNPRADLPNRLQIVPNKNASRAGLNWEALGFQGADPTTDFRGTGKLGVRQFRNLAVSYSSILGDMLVESNNSGDGSLPWYRPALISIHITRMVMQLLQQGLLVGYLVSQQQQQLLCRPTGTNRNANHRDVEQYRINPKNNSIPDGVIIANSSLNISTGSEIGTSESTIFRKRKSSQNNCSDQQTHYLLDDLSSAVGSECRKNCHQTGPQGQPLPELSSDRLGQSVDQTQRAVDRLHGNLVVRFHEFWKAKVEMGNVTSVLQTEQVLVEFRTLIIAELWSGAL